MLKRFTLLLLALIIMLALFTPISAAQDIIFTIIDDELQTNVTRENVPIKLGTQFYVAYTALSKTKSVSSYYNTSYQRLLFFNQDSRILTFDLKDDKTYDEADISYAYRAIKRNGTVFVPLSLICQVFEMKYSVLSSVYGTVLRVNSDTTHWSDYDILNIHKNGLYSAYNSYQQLFDEGTGDTPVTPPTGGEDDQTSEKPRKTVYLCFDGGFSDISSAMLDSLQTYGYSASFFVTASDMANGDAIRKAWAHGHTVGVQLQSGFDSPEEALRELSEANNILKSLVGTRSRIAWLGGDSKSLTDETRDAIIDAGYRIWDSNVDPRSDSARSGTISANFTSMLGKMSKTAACRIQMNSQAASALPAALAYLKRESYYVLPLYEWNTPINKINEYR